MAKICGKCGHLNDDAYNYCTNCCMPLGSEVTVISKEEVERLRKDQTELRNLKEHGYAPEGFQLVGNVQMRNLNDARGKLETIQREGYAPEGYQLIRYWELRSLKEAKGRLDTIQREGYAPSGNLLISRSENDALRDNPWKKWTLRVGAILLVFLVCGLLYTFFTRDSASNFPPPSEYAVREEMVPHDISGIYFPREMNGSNQANASVEILYKDGQYEMNVYTTSITRRYTFSYNLSNGEIFSEQLGTGKARINNLTNETEITFEGWKLVK